uniref:Uncharacterized protein n=1 Tax=Candidatus Kentrum sp. TUN TaxID=2126343 RepID=A0A450ZRW0_9GAMM|nr:MAG: hypothetical protein BECKTUN1418D_GA0071000_104916 [Candidatus Kentron sp. TUN]
MFVWRPCRKVAMKIEGVLLRVPIISPSMGIMEERQFSNALAEAYLDRKGYPGPSGR